MDLKDLKKILAGLCIAGLITGSAVTLSGCDSAQSA
jgi:radical SAM modification target selenobiotic family peptide